MSNSIHIKNKTDEGLLVKVSHFKEKIRKTSPHKHDDYYEFIYLSEGEGFHWIDTEKFMVAPPELYILKPGHLHFRQFASAPKGFVIYFKTEFFNTLIENDVISIYYRTKLSFYHNS